MSYVLVRLSDLEALTRAAPITDPHPIWYETLAGFLGRIAWPLAVVILVLRILGTPQFSGLLSKLLQRTTQISVAGFDIKLSDGAKATLEDVQTLISQVPEAQYEWVANSHLDERFLQSVSMLQKYLCSPNPDFPQPLGANEFRTLRFTLHVPDVLLTHTVRQLVDYVGSTERGAGRIFSTRRGIVGLAWRLEKSAFETVIYSEDDLVEKWGMTRREAKDLRPRKLLLAFVLKDRHNLPLAILYADGDSGAMLEQPYIGPHNTESAFARVDSAVQEVCARTGLIDALQDLEKARAKVTQIDIFRQPNA